MNTDNYKSATTLLEENEVLVTSLGLSIASGFYKTNSIYSVEIQEKNSGLGNIISIVSIVYLICLNLFLVGLNPTITHLSSFLLMVVIIAYFFYDDLNPVFQLVLEGSSNIKIVVLESKDKNFLWRVAEAIDEAILIDAPNIEDIEKSFNL